MASQFMPRRATGSAFVRNSCSMATASLMMVRTRSLLGLFTRCLNMRQAKSQ